MKELEKNLGYTFTNSALLEQALTHPSISYESKRKIEDNQRMEFLGDAVLQLSLTILLYRKFPEMDEGQLTQLRAQMVNKTMLERVALDFHLDQFLILGRGEEMNQGRLRASNLADAMEAVIGAIFEDAGFASIDQWIAKAFAPHLEKILLAPVTANPKGELQELLQARGQETPTYEIVEESGPDHAKNYIVAVKVNDEELGRGQGGSKRAAEMEAAVQALERMKGGN
ncbi:MAG: ribonuclease III [bacterium]